MSPDKCGFALYEYLQQNQAINQTARQEPPPQQKTRAELRDEELKQTRGQRMKPPRRPKRPDGS